VQQCNNNKQLDFLYWNCIRVSHQTRNGSKRKSNNGNQPAPQALTLTLTPVVFPWLSSQRGEETRRRRRSRATDIRQEETGEVWVCVFVMASEMCFGMSVRCIAVPSCSVESAGVSTTGSHVLLVAPGSALADRRTGIHCCRQNAARANCCILTSSCCQGSFFGTRRDVEIRTQRSAAHCIREVR